MLDNLNSVNWKNRAIPYREYFEAMELTEEQIDKRIDLSNDLEDMMFFFFALIATIEFNEENYFFIREQLRNRYQVELNKNALYDERLTEYTETFAEEVTRSTYDHKNDIWFVSPDRAMFVAENEANTIYGYDDFVKAKEQGKTRKRWIAFIDKRTRKTHAAIANKVLGIDEFFKVGKATMFYPKDVMFGDGINHPEEVVNCRCSIKYL